MNNNRKLPHETNPSSYEQDCFLRMVQFMEKRKVSNDMVDTDKVKLDRLIENTYTPTKMSR